MVDKLKIQKLMKEAIAAQVRAQARYSGIKVGAAIMTSDGRIFRGANFENASLGLTVCSERVAAISALMAGCMNWEVLAIAFDGIKAVPPCGACCQFLAEFDSGNLVIAWGVDKESIQIAKLSNLLPRSFKLISEKEKE